MLWILRLRTYGAPLRMTAGWDCPGSCSYVILNTEGVKNPGLQCIRAKEMSWILRREAPQDDEGNVHQDDGW